MDSRPPPRLLNRAFVLVFVSLFSFSLWILIAPPAALAPYQLWFTYAIDLVFALWFLCCSLFFHARVAPAIGTGQHSPLVPWLGSKGVRLFFLLVGLHLLIGGIGGLLLHWFF